MNILRFTQIAAAALMISVVGPTGQASAMDNSTESRLTNLAFTFANRIIYGLGSTAYGRPAPVYPRQVTQTIPRSPSGYPWSGSCVRSGGYEYVILEDKPTGARLKLNQRCPR